SSASPMARSKRSPSIVKFSRLRLSARKNPSATKAAIQRALSRKRRIHGIIMHQGILELHPKGYGFLRNPAKNYVAQPADPFVDQKLIQKYKLREGLQIAGPTESGQRGSGPRLKDVVTIEGVPAAKFVQRYF